MRIACATIAYREPRFIKRFVPVMLERVDKVLVLNGTEPLFGDFEEGTDETATIAEGLGAEVIRYPWKTEPDMRNAGQEYLSDYDWIIWLDPDEYLLEDDWNTLIEFIESCPISAIANSTMSVYWKNGYVIDPPENHTPIVAARPTVRFVATRVIDSPYIQAPIHVHHFSWARTDEEVQRKVTHYGEADKFDGQAWFDNVWSKWTPDSVDLHPVNPPVLERAIPVILPDELEKLDLWPNS